MKKKIKVDLHIFKVYVPSQPGYWEVDVNPFVGFERETKHFDTYIICI